MSEKAVPVAVTKVEIGVSATEGQHLDLAGIEYAGDRPMGPGGWEIIVGLNEDEYPALFLQDVQTGGKKAVVMGGENNPIDYFAITQKSAEGKTRTITYESGKTYVTGVSLAKLMKEGKYIVEIKLICIGTRTASPMMNQMN
jgi:hypothetical protein